MKKEFYEKSLESNAKSNGHMFYYGPLESLFQKSSEKDN